MNVICYLGVTNGVLKMPCLCIFAKMIKADIMVYRLCVSRKFLLLVFETEIRLCVE